MEIIIRTAAGEADISVVAPGRERARIADVLAAATGQTAPSGVYVGDRLVDADQTLAEAGVLAGDLISTSRPVPHDGSVATLIQVAGPGAGSARPLRPGRFRLGPGRRVVAEELSFAPVDEPVVTLTVHPDSSVDVQAQEAGQVITDDGPLGERPRRWGSGVLLAGQRAFLHRPATELGPDFGSQHGILEALLRLSPPDEALNAAVAADGTIPLPSADDGRSPARRWTERLDAPTAFQVMAGMTAGAPGPDDIPGPAGSMTGIPLNLRAATAVGVVGTSDHTRGMARGILLQAAAAHGPTDLRIVVGTTSEGIHAWEWLKWLPHTRGRYGPLVFTTGAELLAWHASAPPAAALTVLLADHPSWWSGRDAPLTPFMRAGAPPAGAAATTPVTMCGDASLLSSACDVTVTIGRDARGTLAAPGRTEVPMVPVLPPVWVADDFARRMARYRDPVVAPAHRDTEIASPSLRDLLGAIVPAWSRRGVPDPPWSIPIGLSRVGGWVALDPVHDGPNILVGGSEEADGVGAVTESIVLSSAATTSPRDLAMVLLEVDGRSTFQRCARLPHTVMHIVGPRRATAWRFSRWLRAVIAARRAALRASGAASIDDGDELPFARLLIAVDELVPLDPDVAVLTDDITRVVDDLGDVGIHLLVGTRRPDALRDHPLPGAGTRIALRTSTTAQSEAIIGVADAAGLPRFGAGQALLCTSGVILPFRPAGFPVAASPQDRTPAGTLRSPTASPVTVRPFVIGRQFSSVERRLADERAAMPDRSLDPFAGPLLDAIARAAGSVDVAGRHPEWLRELPDELPLADLLDDTGDPSVPFALVDRPDELDQRPLRWSPLRGESMLIVGGPRSGAQATVPTLLVAAAATLDPGQLRLHLVGSVWASSPGRPEAVDDAALVDLLGLPHVQSVVTGESMLVALARELAGSVSRRLESGPEGRPADVVLVERADQFHAGLSERGRQAWDQLASAIVAGHQLGVSIVVSCAQPWPALVDLLDQLGATRLDFDAAPPAAGIDVPAGDPPPGRRGRGMLVDDDGTELAEFQLASVPPDLRTLPGWPR